MADGGGNLNDGDGQGQAGSTPVTGIQPPQALVIDSNITDNWKKWQNYSLITNLSRQTEQCQVALLLHTLGDDALRAYNRFSFVSTEENRTVDKILSSLTLLPSARLMKHTNVLCSIKGIKRKENLLKHSTVRSELSSKCVTSAKTALTLFCGTTS